MPTTYSLAGMPDGLYTLEVQAVDQANNTSYPAWSKYVLLPSAPVVHPPANQDPTAVWTVEGDSGDNYLCTLLRNGQAVVGQQPCSNDPSYDMSGRPAGQYTLSVVAVGHAGFPSAAGTATWTWDGVASPPPPPPPPPPGGNTTHQHHQVSLPPPPTPPNAQQKYGQQLRHQVGNAIPSPPSWTRPLLPDGVSSAVQNAVHTVGSAAGGTGFPLILLGLLFGFLLLQNRIDRRDPKLALATVAADDTVEFQPPPSQEDRP
jgi:hypothetical protein